MSRVLIAMLALLIVAQTSLAAADAHVLHEVSGEVTHHHQSASPGDLTDAGGADHGCQHCCHGHSIKCLSAVALVFAPAPTSAFVWKTPEHIGLLIAPDSPPPIF